VRAALAFWFYVSKNLKPDKEEIRATAYPDIRYRSIFQRRNNHEVDKNQIVAKLSPAFKLMAKL